jgi:hypothetical protein
MKKQKNVKLESLKKRNPSKLFDTRITMLLSLNNAVATSAKTIHNAASYLATGHGRNDEVERTAFFTEEGYGYHLKSYVYNDKVAPLFLVQLKYKEIIFVCSDILTPEHPDNPHDDMNIYLGCMEIGMDVKWGDLGEFEKVILRETYNIVSKVLLTEGESKKMIEI